MMRNMDLLYSFSLSPVLNALLQILILTFINSLKYLTSTPQALCTEDPISVS